MHYENGKIYLTPAEAASASLPEDFPIEEAAERSIGVFLQVSILKAKALELSRSPLSQERSEAKGFGYEADKLHEMGSEILRQARIYRETVAGINQADKTPNSSSEIL